MTFEELFRDLESLKKDPIIGPLQTEEAILKTTWNRACYETSLLFFTQLFQNPNIDAVFLDELREKANKLLVK